MLKNLFFNGRSNRRFCSIKQAFDPSPLSSNTNNAGLNNRQPILDVLKDKMGKIMEYNRDLNVLEMGSGKGMHINYFAQHFRESSIGNNIRWQPTDRNEDTFEMISDNILEHENGDSVMEPVVFDLTEPMHRYHAVEDTRYDLIFAINIFHCTSFECWQRFIRHSFYNLLNVNNPNRMIIIYGPFNVENEYTSESNEEFDAYMKETGGNQDYYLKDVTAMNEYANEYSLELVETIPMPSNNFCLIFQTLDRQMDDSDTDMQSS